MLFLNHDMGLPLQGPECFEQRIVPPISADFSPIFASLFLKMLAISDFWSIIVTASLAACFNDMVEAEQ
jgi:hypothetical protein